MFSGDEIPEAAWPGQLIYRNEDADPADLQRGLLGGHHRGGSATTFVGSTVPVSQNIGDVWFNTADNNRMYVAKIVGADEIDAGEWEVISSAPPPITATTHIYQAGHPADAATDSAAEGERLLVPDPGATSSTTTTGRPRVALGDGLGVAGTEKAIKSSLVEYSVSASETVAPTTGWSAATPTRTPGSFIWVRTTYTRNDDTTSVTNPALMTGNTGATQACVPGDTGSDRAERPDALHLDQVREQHHAHPGPDVGLAGRQDLPGHRLQQDPRTESTCTPTTPGR